MIQMNKIMLIIFFQVLINANYCISQNINKIEETKNFVNLNIPSKKQNNIWEDKIIPSFMIIMGTGMVGIWSVDIASGKFKNQGNFFRWQNEGGDYMWTHISAEYITGLTLITSGISLFADKNWAVSVSLVSLGALTYTSLNNLGWTFVEKNRYGYAVPMGFGLIGSIVSISILL